MTKILYGRVAVICSCDTSCWDMVAQGPKRLRELVQAVQLQILILPLTSCVTMKKLLNLSDHQLHYLKSGDNMNLAHRVTARLIAIIHKKHLAYIMSISVVFIWLKAREIWLFWLNNKHRSITEPHYVLAFSSVWWAKDIHQFFISQFVFLSLAITLGFWKTWPVFEMKSTVCIVSPGRNPGKLTKFISLSNLS